MTFWKSFFSSLLAFVAGFVLLIVIGIAIIAGIVAVFSSNEPVAVKDKSVLQINLNYTIPEQTTYAPFSDYSFSDMHPTVSPGVYDIVKTIEKAKTDDKIKGIYLTFGGMDAGVATAEQIRNALLDFKQSGKFIVSYAELYSEKAYYLCSAADKVYVNPKGAIEYNGMSAQLIFFKELLKKVGVEAQVFYDGKFKSATEPFRLDSMSKENDTMTSVLLNDIYHHIINAEAATRNKTAAYLDSVNNNFLVQNANDCKTYGIADEVWFGDQVRDYIKQQLGIGEKDDINYISLEDYLQVPAKSSSSYSDDRIALIYAQGDIVDGKGSDDNIGSAKFVKLLRDARENDKIKAIVLRVNSPGGSALASDVIAREVELTVQKKPVVISMGDYAASGGYYISCLASKIVAQPTTLTGSIGVFGILPNLQKLFNEKLGIHIDAVNTGKYSDFGSIARPVRPDEAAIIQQGVDTIYRDFKETVMRGRKLDGNFVDSIAQGRVWTGTQALQFGLVDTLGGIDDAITLAAKLANTTKYRISEYPEVDHKWYDIFKSLEDSKEEKAVKEQLGTYYPMWNELQSLANMQGVQARMPAVITIE